MVGMVRGEREVDNGNGSVMGNIEASDSKGIEVWDGWTEDVGCGIEVDSVGLVAGCGMGPKMDGWEVGDWG